MRPVDERAQAALKIKDSRTWKELKAEIYDIIEEKRSAKSFESAGIFGIQSDVLLELIDNIEHKHSLLAQARQQAESLSPNDFV